MHFSTLDSVFLGQEKRHCFKVQGVMTFVSLRFTERLRQMLIVGARSQVVLGASSGSEVALRRAGVCAGWMLNQPAGRTPPPCEAKLRSASAFPSQAWERGNRNESAMNCGGRGYSKWRRRRRRALLQEETSPQRDPQSQPACRAITSRCAKPWAQS